METPYFDHLSSTDYKCIYEPAEDTFFLIDALEYDIKYIEEVLKPEVCLEIGSGSGVIITALAKRVKNTLYLATDINPFACKATKRTARRNQCNVDSICCNLVDCLRQQTVDLLIFNPPYVATAADELQKIPISTLLEENLVRSWAGGINGRQVIDNLILKQLPKILSKHGVLYLLLIKENKPDEVMQLLTSVGFKSEQLIERRIPGEHLYIIKAIRS